jgi:hypothetical protein
MEKELNPLQEDTVLQNTTKIEIPVPREYSLKATERKVRGHQIFAWDPEQGTILPVQASVELEMTDHPVNSKLSHSVVRHKVNQNPKMVYVQALNKENAAKRVLKIIAMIKLKQLAEKVIV